MRIFWFVAVICIVIAMICAGAPTTVLSLSWAFWLCGAILAWLIDNVVGTVPISRGP